MSGSTWAPSVTSAEDLLRRSGLGDDQAFRELYDLTAVRIFGLARAIVIDRGTAEDVTQDSYLDMWRRAARFDAAASPAVPWMFMITHARAVDHVRRTQRVRKYDTVARSLSEHGSPFDDASETVDTRESATPALRTAMDLLTLLQREAIQLTYWSGLTGPEASRVLEIPLPTFKARLRDGLLALRAADARSELRVR